MTRFSLPLVCLLAMAGARANAQAKPEFDFDKPIMFINVCNQLGNCFLQI